MKDKDQNLIWEGFRAHHGRDTLTWEQEEEIITMLQHAKEPKPSAEELIIWANAKFDTQMSPEKSVANKRLKDIFNRHNTQRVKRDQGHSKT
jgi:hypothetical protein